MTASQCHMGISLSGSLIESNNFFIIIMHCALTVKTSDTCDIGDGSLASYHLQDFGGQLVISVQ